MVVRKLGEYSSVLSSNSRSLSSCIVVSNDFAGTSAHRCSKLVLGLHHSAEHFPQAEQPPKAPMQDRMVLPKTVVFSVLPALLPKD
jgi:hypothetical protein